MVVLRGDGVVEGLVHLVWDGLDVGNHWLLLLLSLLLAHLLSNWHLLNLWRRRSNEKVLNWLLHLLLWLNLDNSLKELDILLRFGELFKLIDHENGVGDEEEHDWAHSCPVSLGMLLVVMTSGRLNSWTMMTSCLLLMMRLTLHSLLKYHHIWFILLLLNLNGHLNFHLVMMTVTMTMLEDILRSSHDDIDILDIIRNLWPIEEATIHIEIHLLHHLILSLLHVSKYLVKVVKIVEGAKMSHVRWNMSIILGQVFVDLHELLRLGTGL